MMLFADQYMGAVVDVACAIDVRAIEALAERLSMLRLAKGRVFVLGIGGSAANASHCVADLRKLCNIEAYAPTDNVAELTARANDEGWDTVFSVWLAGCSPTRNDAVLVLSVGGGDVERNVSAPIVSAVDLARFMGCAVYGILGRNGGHTARHADIAIMVPTLDDTLVTPLAESFQAVVWHCLVSHPKLQVNRTKW